MSEPNGVDPSDEGIEEPARFRPLYRVENTDAFGLPLNTPISRPARLPKLPVWRRRTHIDRCEPADLYSCAAVRGFKTGLHFA
jgi:hypothetical protein